MRDGKARSIDPREIVTGDILTANRVAYRADVLGDERRVVQYLRSLPVKASS